MATAQALTVFIQNQPACADCCFWRQCRCPDPWFHENTGVCSTCGSVLEMREEHDAECPARDIRMLAQASSMLRDTLRRTQPWHSGSGEASPLLALGDAPPSEADPASSDGDTDVSFDEEQIMREHFRTCEFCSPFQKTKCNGTRECREMAGHSHALSCQRMTYICKDMPKSNPRDCPLQERIVALAVRRASNDGRTQ